LGRLLLLLLMLLRLLVLVLSSLMLFSLLSLAKEVAAELLLGQEQEVHVRFSKPCEMKRRVHVLQWRKRRAMVKTVANGKMAIEREIRKCSMWHSVYFSKFEFALILPQRELYS
jgi:hypothetical protein